jgi:Tfp pilus assembly protein PilO
MSPSLSRQQLTIDLAGIGACVAILGLGYFFLFGPLLHHKSDVMARNRALATQRQKVIAAQGNARQLKPQLASLRTLSAQDVLQPGKAVRINSRLEQITSLAATRGLEIKGVEPGLSRQESHYQVVPLRLTGTGSFRGCMRFLHDLRQSLHDTTVIAFQLNGTPEARGTPVSFSLDLCWYTAPLVASSQD